MIPAYRIVTPRLVLRCYNPEDAPLLVNSIRESVEHLKPWMPWAHTDHLETIEDKIERLRQMRARFDRSEDFVYGIFNAEEACLIGGCGLHSRLGSRALEIGYWIHKDFTHQGIATESAAALTKVAFEVHKVARLEIHCDPANVYSAEVPRKLGYTHEGTLKRRVPFLENWRDSMIWTLFAENYPNSPAAQAQFEAYDAMRRRISFQENL